MSLNLSQSECLGEAIREAGIPLKSALALIEADRDQENGRWTHGEAHREAERFAAFLQDLDFKSSDRCALLMSNQSKWVLSALGVFWAGGVLVPLDYKLTPREQAALLAHSRSKILIVEWPIWERFQREKIPLSPELRVIVTEAPPQGLPCRERSLGDLPLKFFSLSGGRERAGGYPPLFLGYGRANQGLRANPRRFSPTDRTASPRGTAHGGRPIFFDHPREPRHRFYVRFSHAPSLREQCGASAGLKVAIFGVHDEALPGHAPRLGSPSLENAEGRD